MGMVMVVRPAPLNACSPMVLRLLGVAKVMLVRLVASRNAKLPMLVTGWLLIVAGMVTMVGQATEHPVMVTLVPSSHQVRPSPVVPSSARAGPVRERLPAITAQMKRSATQTAVVVRGEATIRVVTECLSRGI